MLFPGILGFGLAPKKIQQQASSCLICFVLFYYFFFWAWKWYIISGQMLLEIFLPKEEEGEVDSLILWRDGINEE